LGAYIDSTVGTISQDPPLAELTYTQQPLPPTHTCSFFH
jgi:hypothetical protein